MSWDRYRRGFEQLAREEEGAEPVQLLSACCDYSTPPAILNEKGKPQQPPLCVILAPKNGLWMLSSSQSGSFLERFRTLAGRAGRALGSQKHTDPEGVWLHRLYSYVRENCPEFLAPKIGGRSSSLRHIDTILRICEVSAAFCSRLERKTVTGAKVKSKAMKPATGNTREAILKPILQSKGYSIHDWAKSARLDFHTANNYLKGKTRPFPSTLKRLADALDIAVTKLPA